MHAAFEADDHVAARLLEEAADPLAEVVGPGFEGVIAAAAALTAPEHLDDLLDGVTRFADAAAVEPDVVRAQLTDWAEPVIEPGEQQQRVGGAVVAQQGQRREVALGAVRLLNPGPVGVLLEDARLVGPVVAYLEVAIQLDLYSVFQLLLVLDVPVSRTE